MADRVGLADLGEEAIPQALTRRGAAHQAGDVVELDRLRDLRARTRRLRHGRQALVGDLDDGDIGLHGRERVDGGLGRRPREGVEERRLACVGQADDADLHGRPGSPSEGGRLMAGTRVREGVRLHCRAAGGAALATRSISRSSAPLPPSPGHNRPISEADGGAAEHVRGVVHAEVGPGQADGGGEPVERRAEARSDAPHRGRRRQRRGRVGRREGEVAGSGGQGRQATQPRAGPAHGELDQVVDPDRRRERPRRRAASARGAARRPRRPRARSRARPHPTLPPCRAPSRGLRSAARGRASAWCEASADRALGALGARRAA